MEPSNKARNDENDLENNKMEMEETLRAAAKTHEAARKLRNKEKSLIFELKDAEISSSDSKSIGNTASAGKQVEIQDGERNRISEFDSDQNVPAESNNQVDNLNDSKDF